jgi:hypothetical protein
MLLPGVIVCDILDSDNLSIGFHMLHHVKSKNLSEADEKFTDWERFENLASNLISHRIEINSKEEADRATRDFKSSIASVYRLSASKVTLSDINNHDLPRSDHFIKHKQTAKIVTRNQGSSVYNGSQLGQEKLSE